MSKRTIEHEEKITKRLEELELQGYKTINLNNKSPNGIAIKDGKIFAVEVLRKVKSERKNPEIIKKHGRFVWRFQSGYTIVKINKLYSMFDGVLISSFKPNKENVM